MMTISEDKKFKKKFNNIINKYPLAKDEKLFLDDFFCLCNCVNVNERIPLFKRIEFLIDRRGENKYDAVIETLKKVVKDKDTLEYIDEVEIINSIFVESKKLQAEIKKIKPEKRLAAMLLSASMVYHDKKNIPSNYRDKHIDLVNKTIKSLVFDNEIYQEDAFLYSNRDYYAFDIFGNKTSKNIHIYFQNSFLTCLFEESFLEWKYGDRKFEKIDKYTISSKLISNNCNFYYFSEIKTLLCEQLFAFYFCCASKISSLNNLSDYKKHVFYRLDRYLFSDCKMEQVSDIPIEQWVNAYCALREHAKKDDESLELVSNSLLGYLINRKRSRTKKGWIRLLEKGGVDSKYSEKLFDLMVFNKKSVDIYDNPFIPCEKRIKHLIFPRKIRYVILPYILKEMDVSLVLMSKFGYQLNVDFKGKRFEKYILDVFNYMGYPAINLHKRIDGKEYECDVAFILGKALFLCECKSRKSYRFEDFDKRDFEKDSNQLNRIADFYKANKKIVKEQFKLKKGVNIEYDKVKCIVVHSRIMHGMVKKNNVYALDIYKFLQPFNRDAITEYLIELNPELKYCLQGEVTADKILKYYENPFCIYNYVNCLKTHNTTYSVGEYTIIQDGILIEDWKKLIDHDRLFSLILEKNLLAYEIKSKFLRGEISEEDIWPELKQELKLNK